MNEAGPVAETTISPRLRRRLQECYDHATKLMAQDKYDIDYAHTMLVECVAKDPGNLVYLEAFFENLHRKYNNNKRGSLLSFGGKGPFKKAVAKEDWVEALKLGPEVLKANPWDVGTLRGMAHASAGAGHHEPELRYLKYALEVKPNDAEVNKHCAESLTRLGQYDQAIACWHRVDEAKRGDLTAQKMISELQIEKTQQRMGGGKEAGRGKPRVGRPEASRPETRDQTPQEPERRREIPLTHRQELEQAVAINPTDVDAYFDLVRLHVEEHRLGEAVHVLHKALAASGNDIKVQERLEDVEGLRKREQLAIAERRAAEKSGADAEQLAEDLRNDLNRYELDVYDRRSQRYPQDLDLKFQLGLRLKRMENYRAAVECFQLAAQLPNRKAGVALELGECLQRLKQYGKALECYRDAVTQSTAPDAAELHKLALYRGGVLAAGLKNVQSTEEMLSRLVQLDPDYKDAATRLDKFRQMHHKA